MDRQREEYDQCTFRPQISRQSELIVAKKFGQDSMKLEDRLLQKTQKRPMDLLDEPAREADPEYVQKRDSLALRSIMKNTPELASADVYTRLSQAQFKSKK